MADVGTRPTEMEKEKKNKTPTLVSDPEGVAWAPPPPLPPSFLNILRKWNNLELFHFHGIFKKNEIKSAKRTPTPLYI